MTQSPIRKAEDRTVRLPDSDRTWLAFGFNYKLNKQTSIDAGYAHLFFDKEKIDCRTVLGTTATSQFVRGSFDTSVEHPVGPAQSQLLNSPSGPRSGLKLRPLRIRRTA